MNSQPVTPGQKEGALDGDQSRLHDQSDDDSDTNDVGKDNPSPGERDDKAHDQEATFTEEVNTDYSLFSNPPALAATRQRLFDVRDEIEMSPKDFDELFPFMDNVWRKYRATESQNESEAASEFYCCRLKPSGQHKTPTPKPHVEGKQQRRKRKREEKSCSMLMKVTHVESPVKKVKITRALGSDHEHSHDLDYMDQNKRNSAVMDVARREATKGFLPGSIYWKMQEEPAKMDEAGGKFMKVSDVRNVQYPWRQQNMSAVLKAHSGYSQQRSGPRQRASNSNPATPKNGTARPHQPPQVYTSQPPQLQALPLPQAQTHPQSQPQPPTYAPTYVPAAPPPLPTGTLHYPEHAKDFLRTYLPYPPQMTDSIRPHVTLTWAQSLDGRLALQSGVQTAVSGPETKAMTHFLRSQHNAILIGVNTAIADDPGLNCRLVGAGGYGGSDRVMQPRPIILDPRARLPIHSNMRLLKAASEGKALGPWIVVGPGVRLASDAVATLKRHGGEFLQINEISHQGLDWQGLFRILHREGIKSIMIEGGGKVLSDLLNPRYTDIVDSVIITIAPTLFGQNGVQASPETAYERPGQAIQTRLSDVRWQPMGQSDMVLCGHLTKSQPPRLPGIEHFSRHAPQPPPPPSQHPQAPSLPPPNNAPSPFHSTQHPPPHMNGHAGTASTSSAKSPQFRHYGPPGQSR